MSAWPIDTSSSQGIRSAKKRRFSRLRSWPAFSPSPQRRGLLRSLQVGGQRRLPVGRIVAGVGFGIKLHAVGSARGSTGNHRRPRIDENRHADSPLVQPSTDVAQKSPVAHGVPPRVGGDGIRRIGHQRHLAGRHLEHQLHEGGSRVALHVELGAQHGFQVAHVAVTNMTGVGPGMDGDPVGSETFDVARRAHHVRLVAPTGVSHDGDLIDVDT